MTYGPPIPEPPRNQQAYQSLHERLAEHSKGMSPEGGYTKKATPPHKKNLFGFIMLALFFAPILIFGTIIYTVLNNDEEKSAHPDLYGFQTRVSDAISDDYPALTSSNIDCSSSLNPDIPYEGNRMTLHTGDIVNCTAVDDSSLYEEEYIYYDIQATITELHGGGSRYNNVVKYEAEIQVQEAS